jgi:hypothetical protein
MRKFLEREGPFLNKLFSSCHSANCEHNLPIFLAVRLGLVSPHKAPLQAQRIKEKHETVKRFN